GIHPWDVLNVGLFETFGFSIGTWNIIIGFTLIGVALILDRTYVKAGTFFNAVIVGSFVDFYLWLDILPQPTHIWTDILIMGLGIVVMGAGGGIYTATGIGSGSQDGVMLFYLVKSNISIGNLCVFYLCRVFYIG